MNYKKILLYGFYIWLIPFVLSFFFFSREGTLLVDRVFFHSIMTVSLIGSFSFFLYLYLKKMDFTPGFEINILTFGFLAVFVSFILDIISLIGFFGLSVDQFLMWVFPVYFNMIIIAVAINKVLSLKSWKEEKK